MCSCVRFCINVTTLYSVELLHYITFAIDNTILQLTMCIALKQIVAFVSIHIALYHICNWQHPLHWTLLQSTILHYICNWAVLRLTMRIALNLIALHNIVLHLQLSYIAIDNAPCIEAYCGDCCYSYCITLHLQLTIPIALKYIAMHNCITFAIELYCNWQCALHWSILWRHSQQERSARYQLGKC